LIIANPFCRKSPSKISVFYRLILTSVNGKGRLGVYEGRERICSWGIKKELSRRAE